MDKELISLRIDEIIKHIDFVTEDLKEISLENFNGNSLLARGTAFSLEQICDHVSKLRKTFEQSHQEIPWDKIYDMRIVLAHMYVTVDCKIVYNTVKNDLPKLKEQMLAIKNSLNWPNKNESCTLQTRFSFISYFFYLPTLQ